MLAFLAGIIPLLIIVSVIVTFHELGHFSVARLFKTRVERFSVGFGKILLRKTDKNGVEWCLSALPLGGYVKFAGDENIASMMPSREELLAAQEAITGREGAAAVQDYFHFKPLWQRFLIILAGPAANFILAIVIFTGLFMLIGDQIGHPTIIGIQPNGAGRAAGLQVGDIVTRIDGRHIDDKEDVVRLVALRADTSFPMVVERGHALVTVMVKPRRGVLGGAANTQGVTGGVLGIMITDKVESRPLNPLQALVKGSAHTWAMLDTNLTYIGRIFTGKENGDQISGIVGMTKVAGDAAVEAAHAKVSLLEKSVGLFFYYVQMTALISIGIGFVNLLPLPALDGGHLMFYIIQGVTRKTVPAGIQNAGFRIAIVLVLSLMLFALWNDFHHIGLVKFLGGLFS